MRFIAFSSPRAVTSETASAARATEAVSLVTSLGLEKAMNRINQRPLR